MRAILPVSVLLLTTACTPVKIDLDSGQLGSVDETGLVTEGTIEDTGIADDTGTTGAVDDTASGSETGETGETGETEPETEPPRPDALWCYDFEDGELTPAGYGSTDFVELYDGALVFNAAEGDDFSALNGEEDVAFRGARGLGLRSSHDGSVESVAIATTPLFEVIEPALFWWVMSEVDSRGVYLGVDIMTEDGVVLASAELPVDTGGHIPGLEPEHDPIAGFPEITEGEGTPGAFTAQQLDVSPWVGQVVKLRIYQHTQQEDQGFFTLFDDICHGDRLDGVEQVTLGDPLDHGA